jgi:hypothetical protein
MLRSGRPAPPASGHCPPLLCSSPTASRPVLENRLEVGGARAFSRAVGRWVDRPAPCSTPWVLELECSKRVSELSLKNYSNDRYVLELYGVCGCRSIDTLHNTLGTDREHRCFRSGLVAFSDLNGNMPLLRSPRWRDTSTTLDSQSGINLN